MTLKNQGVLDVVGEQTSLRFISNPVSTNSYEGKQPYEGEARVQPFQVLDLWRTFEGKREKFIARSGSLYLVVKHFPQKKGVRVLFTTADRQSSYFLRENSLIRFMDDLLREIKKIQALSIKAGDNLSVIKIGESIVLRQGDYEFYLKKDDARKMRNFIEKNFIMREPIPHKAGIFTIDKDKNLLYRNKINLPLQYIKDIYNLIL